MLLILLVLNETECMEVLVRTLIRTPRPDQASFSGRGAGRYKFYIMRLVVYCRVCLDDHEDSDK